MKTLTKLIPILISIILISCNQTIPNDPKEEVIIKEDIISHLDWTKNANIYEVNIRQYTKE